MWARALVILILAISLTGCASTMISMATGGPTKSKRQTESLNSEHKQPKILLMPLDVELSSLQVSGLTEPKAEWTENAKRFMLSELRRVQAERGFNLMEFDLERVDNSPQSPLIATQKLHRVVGNAIMASATLPTKKKKFDWTLGPETAAVAKEFDADYGLFLYIRDSYTSSGRMIFNVLVGGLANAKDGVQTGFASLVDLRTGDVVWFNNLMDFNGDLRSEKGAATTIANLLKDMPK